MRQMARPMPPKPADTDPLTTKIYWLVETHGFDPRANRVVDLYEPSGYCSMTLEAFKTLYMSWYEDVPRERGKPTRAYATAAWLLHPRRVEVAGVRMRPDKGFPAYLGDDGVEVFKNIYRQPAHEGAENGDVQPVLDFLDRFVPDERERNGLLDWITHKLLHPEIPGCSLWFVADRNDGPREGRYGTGRGFLGRIAVALFGEAYCRAEDFDILTGTSAQSVYTDWQADCILVMVDEAHTSPTAHRKGEKRSVYTALKNCIDPAPKRRSFKVKGRPSYDGTSYASIWVFTNHANAAAIPPGDRRITVLRNGREMTPEEARTIDAWLKVPANIAALVAYLTPAADEMAAFKARFNMYVPMQTSGKEEMADLSRNEVEEVLLELAEEAPGLVFPRVFLERRVLEVLNMGNERDGSGSAAIWRGQLAGAFHEHCGRVKASGVDRARIRVNNHRYDLYAFWSRMAEAILLTETERREHAAKWGHIDSTQTVFRTIQGGPQENEDAGPG